MLCVEISLPQSRIWWFQCFPGFENSTAGKVPQGQDLGVWGYHKLHFRAEILRFCVLFLRQSFIITDNFWTSKLWPDRKRFSKTCRRKDTASGFHSDWFKSVVMCCLFGW